MGHSITELVTRIKCKCVECDEIIREAADLTPAEYKVICSIECDEKVNGTDFANKIGLSISRSSRIIDKMSKDEYLTVQKNSSDRRSIYIMLTPKSMALKKEIEESHTECSDKIFNSLEEDECKSIITSLEQLLSVL